MKFSILGLVRKNWNQVVFQELKSYFLYVSDVSLTMQNLCTQGLVSCREVWGNEIGQENFLLYKCLLNSSSFRWIIAGLLFSGSGQF